MLRAAFLPLVLALLALSASASLPASAEERSCPIKNSGDDYVAKVTKAIEAKACPEAHELAESCALGASGDTAIAGSAAKLCEKGFAKNKDDVALYAKLSKRCDAKYAKSEGTMYVSMAAFCKLSAAELLFQLNAPVE